MKGEFMKTDLDVLRSYFPVTKKYTFFNNAAESPMHTLCRSAVDNFYDLACNSPQKKPNIRWDIRENLAKLLGGTSNEYALVTSTGIGTGIVAAGIEWQTGDNIVLPENEHRNNLYPWINLQKKGVELRFVPVAENGYISLSDFESLIDSNTKLVAVAAVRFNSGFRISLKALSEIVHRHNALFLVDGIQAAGVVPLNVDEMNIDILCSAGFKWLLGLPGTGFLYVKKEVQHLIQPVIPGMFAADSSDETLVFHRDARKYETGSLAYSQFYGWLEGLKLLESIGIEHIYSRILYITDLIIDGLKQRNIPIFTPIDKPSERSAILFCSFGGYDLNETIANQLKDKGIIIAVRDGKCRISPSFYNTKEEVEYFFDSIDCIYTRNR